MSIPFRFTLYLKWEPLIILGLSLSHAYIIAFLIKFKTLVYIHKADKNF